MLDGIRRSAAGAEGQLCGRKYRVEIRKCPREGRLEIRYLAINPEGSKALETAANGIDTLAEQLAYIHDTMFGMKGEIIHVG